MGRRSEVRGQRSLTVRLLGMDAHERPLLETVHTLNVSRHGVVVAGVGSHVNPGEVLSLQYKGKKVRYRVVWIGEGETAGQLGLEQLNQKDNLWQDDLPLDVELDPETTTRVRGKERRQQRRFEASLPVEVKSSSGVPIRAQISDISLSGCYVSTLFPVPLHSVVTIIFWLGEDKLVLRGRVRTSVLGVGCGIEFVEFSAEPSNKLAAYLQGNCKVAVDRRKRVAADESEAAGAVRTARGR
jgi:PilZ domain